MSWAFIACSVIFCVITWFWLRTFLGWLFFTIGIAWVTWLITSMIRAKPDLPDLDLLLLGWFMLVVIAPLVCLVLDRRNEHRRNF